MNAVTIILEEYEVPHRVEFLQRLTDGVQCNVEAVAGGVGLMMRPESIHQYIAAQWPFVIKHDICKQHLRLP